MDYYNENDQRVADWIEGLQVEGSLPVGIVDRRSITDVQSKDLHGIRQANFFAGIGGWPLALKLAGWPEDQEVWTGSCPCQPFSVAGSRKGTKDKRHLWPIWFDLIEKRRPPTIFGEQVASPLGRKWLSGVRSDLESLGYAVGGADLPAACVAAPQIRQRLFWVASTTGGHPSHEQIQRSWKYRFGKTNGSPGWRGDCSVGNGGLRRVGSSCGQGSQRNKSKVLQPAGRKKEGRAATKPSAAPRYWDAFDVLKCADGKARRIEPGTFPLAHGISGRMVKLRAYGNAIVPEAAAEFIKAYLECLPK